VLPLTGVRVLLLAVNLPGPLAAARLRELGAAITKIEPPEGDPLAAACPTWYAGLHAGVAVERLNLKHSAARDRLDSLLAANDLLITALRPAALARLGLDWTALHARYPGLSQVAILGYPGPAADRPGHDLTYQAELGLLQPPHLPRALLADYAGAEQAVSAALALLLAQARGQGSGTVDVTMAGAAEAFAAPLHHGLTAPGGVLGGGLPAYGLYAAADGWVAVAALEPAFRHRLEAALGGPLTHDALTAFFATRPAHAWEAWGRDHDLPVAAVCDPPFKGATDG
jgi:crotonobetainyl-CoA:carnitine CoA-transferase CaiB-like acyl-CoA transferase